MSSTLTVSTPLSLEHFEEQMKNRPGLSPVVHGILPYEKNSSMTSPQCCDTARYCVLGHADPVPLRDRHTCDKQISGDQVKTSGTDKNLTLTLTLICVIRIISAQQFQY